LNVPRAKLLEDQGRLNTRFLRIRHLDALHIDEDLVRVFQMEVDAHNGLPSRHPPGEKTLMVLNVGGASNLQDA
jgi:hypothetical protein